MSSGALICAMSNNVQPFATFRRRVVVPTGISPHPKTATVGILIKAKCGGRFWNKVWYPDVHNFCFKIVG